MVRKLVIVSLVIYAWLLVWIILLKMCDPFTVEQNYQWLSTLTLKERFLFDIIPFYVRFNHLTQYIEFLLNCLIFAPFGVIFSFLFKKRNVLRDVIICFSVSLLLELLQLFTMLGGFATVDLITNTAGYFVGLALYEWFFKRRSMKFNEVFVIVMNVLFSGVVIYSVITMINCWDLLILILTRQY
ncbi:MAG: VanZ family protein [Clostridia bacterium]|nr:VanZ family protein [Clostridia bacterium]